MSENESVYRRLCNILPSLRSEYQHYTLQIDRNGTITTRLLSEFFTGTLTNKDSGEVTHIVIKVVPAFSFIKSYEEIYRNEVYLYSQIFDELNKFQKQKEVKDPITNLPNYLGGHSSANKEFIVLENLSIAGYKLYHGNECLTPEHLETIFKTYARFHALSFVYKHEYPDRFQQMANELVDIVKLLNGKELAQPIATAYSAAVNSFNAAADAEIIKKLRDVSNIREVAATGRAYDGDYACLIHGNCSMNNLMFKYSKSGDLEHIKMIDFQLAYISTPVHDLSYIFYSGASKADMDKLDYYLDLYYNTFASFVLELGANPKEIYPYEALKSEWKKYSVIGIAFGIIGWVKKLMNRDEVVNMYNQNMPRDIRIDSFRRQMLEICNGKPFTEQANAICRHAVEYGIF
ncbi:uncharacterized protein LOC109545372 [Dendroctonus ponderosae]